MGRIADALKKAQSEREDKIRVSAAETRPGAGLAGAGAAIADAAVVGGGLRSVNAAPASDRGFIIGEPDLPLRHPGTLRSSRRSPAAIDPWPKWEAHPTLVSLSDRTSAITEQYRAVRTWLLSHSPVAHRSCVAITSSVAREGKSVTAANLAIVLAEIRHMNVLIVDADLRRSSQARLLQLPGNPGLGDVVAGRAPLDAAVVRTPIPNLSFLPAGSCHGLNPTELLNSRAASLVFDDVRDRFHHVVVDTPPVQWVSDTGVIGSYCTGIVMVVRMHKTASQLVRQSVRWLQSNNLNVLGCIAAAGNVKTSRRAYEYGDDES